MNILKVFTVATSEPDQFFVYWTNSSVCLKGIIKIRVTANIEDRAIAAELSATKYLLEQKCVLGQNIVGNAGIRLSVSSGAIRKLMHRKSNKTHLIPYAQFLTTRYAGCQLASDSGVLEVSRHSPWSDMKNIESGKREARYFLNPNKKRILVITDNPREGKRLVTTYPASPYFTPLRKAA
jgi:hypothetical protein